MNKFNFFIKLPKLQFTLNKPLKNFLQISLIGPIFMICLNFLMQITVKTKDRIRGIIRIRKLNLTLAGIGRIRRSGYPAKYSLQHRLFLEPSIVQ